MTWGGGSAKIFSKDLRLIGVIFSEQMFICGSFSLGGREYVSESEKREAVKAALKTACVWDLVEKMDQGIDSVISQTSVSGGEKQRLAIARAIFSNPRVLILDEATAAMDVVTEQKVQRALASAGKSRSGKLPS